MDAEVSFCDVQLSVVCPPPIGSEEGVALKDPDGRGMADPPPGRGNVLVAASATKIQSPLPGGVKERDPFGKVPRLVTAPLEGLYQ